MLVSRHKFGAAVVASPVNLANSLSDLGDREAALAVARDAQRQSHNRGRVKAEAFLSGTPKAKPVAKLQGKRKVLTFTLPPDASPAAA